MNTDKFEFGKTPAAIYLANHLLELGDKKVHRKIAKTISEFRSLLRGIDNSHEMGWLKTKQLNMLCPMLQVRCDSMLSALQGIDSLILDLTGNILRGEIKVLIRKGLILKKSDTFKTRTTSHLMNSLAMATDKEDTLLLKELILEVACARPKTTDPITAETLQLKSKAKLKRLNKKDTLY